MVWRGRKSKDGWGKETLLERMHYNKAASLALAPTEEARKRIQAKYDAAPLPPLPVKRARVIRRPVDGKPAHRSEHQEQTEVVSWWNMIHGTYDLPRFALYAIPNGGARDPISGARLKAEGVRPGAPDLCLAAPRSPYHGLYIEMKAGDNKTNDKQDEFLAYLNGAGYKTAVHWTGKSAIEEIEKYLDSEIPF